MPDFSSLISKHFKVQHISAPLVLTIKEVKVESVGQDKDTKPVLYFTEDPRGLVLNATRFNTLAEAHKSALSEPWIGAVVELTADPDVKMNGRKVGTIILKVVKPGKVQ